MWTLAERTTIMSLLRRGIPVAVIVHLLLMNRQGVSHKWILLRQMLAMAVLLEDLYDNKGA